MYKVKMDGREAKKMLKSLVEYTDGFITETKAQESMIMARLSKASVDEFYDYMDQLARVNPGMLHHVYEWGRVGDPNSRLFQLKRALGKKTAVIEADFLQSETPTNTSDQVFYDKARIMEDGITVSIQEVEAEALFFEVDGTEYFRTGPIIVENPGGPEVRGSFVKAFEEFYGRYFEEVYLRAIRYYQYFMDAKPYEQNFSSAIKSSDPRGIGRKTALSWVMNMPVGEM